jgi:hypothetical protein
LGQAIQARLEETLVFYTKDHNGNHMYLGVDGQKPFRILENLNSNQVQDLLKSPYQQSCTFELLAGLNDMPSTSIQLGLNWSSSTFGLMQKPGVESSAMLNVNFVNGEEDVETHSATQYLWNSIRDLERFDNAWKNDGTFVDDRAQSCNSESIMAFLQDYSQNELNVDAKKRQDYDFTDYFWEFIQGILGF